VAWPEFEVQVCYKLVGGRSCKRTLKEMASGLGLPVHYVHSGGFQVAEIDSAGGYCAWTKCVSGHYFPALLLGRKVVLTIHNCGRRNWEIIRSYGGLARGWRHRPLVISSFVWNYLGPKGKAAGIRTRALVAHLPGVWYPPAEARAFLFLGRWIENKV